MSQTQAIGNPNTNNNATTYEEYTDKVILRQQILAEKMNTIPTKVYIGHYDPNTPPPIHFVTPQQYL